MVFGLVVFSSVGRLMIYYFILWILLVCMMHLFWQKSDYSIWWSWIRVWQSLFKISCLSFCCTWLKSWLNAEIRVLYWIVWDNVSKICFRVGILMEWIMIFHSTIAVGIDRAALSWPVWSFIFWSICSTPDVQSPESASTPEQPPSNHHLQIEW